MKVIKGQVAGKGIAIGRLLVYINKAGAADDHRIGDTESELRRFYAARDLTAEEFEELEKVAVSKLGADEAEIFSMHRQLLQDADFEEEVKNEITGNHRNAEYAVTKAGQKLSEIFISMKDNEYMRQRSADLINVADAVVRKLQHGDTRLQEITEPVILMAEDLTPGETIRMDPSKVLSFVTSGGSVNSHTAILARSLGIIPLVNTGRAPDRSWNGCPAATDGTEGILYIDPDEATLQRLKEKQENEWESQRKLNDMIGKPAVTKGGKAIRLYANVGNIRDVMQAIKGDAEGIGLFRSEFLFLGRKDFPTEEEQFESYKKAAELMKGKEVIIRTLDIGADKKADYFGLEEEENPAMGLRAIRICLKRPDIFKTQLRAIYRASAYGDISVMFPLIASVNELEQSLRITDEVTAELDAASIPCGKVRRGIMIETPAAALISDLLAKKADFFCIGTNDLTQYTLAMDRQNAAVTDFVDTYHPAVLRLIEMTATNAHKQNIKVGICGEAGADPGLTEFFIKNGIDELSVPSQDILELRRRIREMI